MEAQLVACVRDSLEAHLHDNARFMCERLWAEFANEENLLLLATVYFRADQAYRAYNLLTGAHAPPPHAGGLSPPARYLLAQCCRRLGRFDEAKAALAAGADGEVPGGAAGCFLLGKLHSLTDNPSAAIACYQAALLRDPLLWVAYEGLCQLGHSEEAAALLERAEQAAGRPAEPALAAAPAAAAAAAADTFATPATGSLSPEAGPGSVAAPAFPAWSAARPQQQQQQDASAAATPEASAFVTPSPGPGPLHMPAPVRRAAAGQRETPQPTPLLRGGARGGRGSAAAADRWKFNDEGKLRKVSNRLFADPASSGRSTAFVTTRRGNRPSPSSPEGSLGFGAPAFRFTAGQNGHGSGASEGQRSAEGAAAVLQLLRQLGGAFGLLCRYQCREALAALAALPESQGGSAWARCLAGRALFECVEFQEAAAAFAEARRRDPGRLEGMEVYSTVLWHLKREVELSHLAQEAVAADRLDPRAWCIMGNCFSLQKDHDAALRFFQRALQLDPAFTYAHTLAGHEGLALEQFDRSLACFRHAIRLDPRHYNAWYGLGQIYYRQEKYEMAAYHFESSLKINGQSSVLRCYVGMAYAKLGRLAEAAAVLRQAVAADGRNPLARFELAQVLVSQGQLPAARAELEALKDMAPGEASVYFQLGKVERRLDNTEKALLYFSAALDLKPSSADVNLIKTAIEHLRISSSGDSDEDGM